MLKRARAFFQWPHSGVLIPLFIGLGGLLLGIGISLPKTEDAAFVLAYVFFLLSAIWAIGFWLTSDTLIERDPRRWSKKIRRVVDTDRALKLYRFWAVLGVIICLSVLFSTVAFTGFVWERKQLSEMQDVLIPADDQTPSNGCGEVTDGVTLIFENGNASIVREFPHTVVALESRDSIPECVRGCPILTLDRDAENGWIRVKIDARDKNNRVIFGLDKDGFHTSPVNRYKIFHGDHNSLGVRDDKDNHVLNVRYINKRAVSIDGLLHVHGYEVRLSPQGKANSCPEVSGPAEFDVEAP
jgi:hypothetical protein